MLTIFRARLDEGLVLMRQELAINPAHAMALYRIGDIYSRQLKWDAAIAALHRVGERNLAEVRPLADLGQSGFGSSAACSRTRRSCSTTCST